MFPRIERVLLDLRRQSRLDDLQVTSGKPASSLIRASVERNQEHARLGQSCTSCRREFDAHSQAVMTTPCSAQTHAEQCLWSQAVLSLRPLASVVHILKS